MPLPEYKQLVDEAKREIKEIDPAELKGMQESKQNFTLIDVREPDEVAEGTIAGAKPLPRGQLEHKIDTITTDKNQPISATAAVEDAPPWRRSRSRRWVLKT